MVFRNRKSVSSLGGVWVSLQPSPCIALPGFLYLWVILTDRAYTVCSRKDIWSSLITPGSLSHYISQAPSPRRFMAEVMGLGSFLAPILLTCGLIFFYFVPFWFYASAASLFCSTLTSLAPACPTSCLPSCIFNDLQYMVATFRL